MRIFLDTNVLASALTTRGLCAELLEIVLNEHQLLLCPPVLAELKDVLPRKFRIAPATVKHYVDLLQTHGQVITMSKAVDIELADADDIPIVRHALAGEADAFVTGDQLLLNLHVVCGMPMQSPRVCWTQLTGLTNE